MYVRRHGHTFEIGRIFNIVVLLVMRYISLLCEQRFHMII